MASVSALVGLSLRGARRGGSRVLPAGAQLRVLRGQSGACVRLRAYDDISQYLTQEDRLPPDSVIDWLILTHPHSDQFQRCHLALSPPSRSNRHKPPSVSTSASILLRHGLP